MWKLGQDASGRQLLAAAFNGDTSGQIEPDARYRRVRPKLGTVSIAQGSGGTRHHFMKQADGLNGLHLEVLQYLIRGLLEDHSVPNVGQIADMFGMALGSAVDAVLESLASMGYIERLPRFGENGGPRFIRILHHPDGRPFALRAE